LVYNTNMKIKEIVDVLDKGGIIIYPTDTVYGIGCLTSFPNSIEKVFEIKQRPKKNPVLIMVKDLEMLKEYTVFNSEEEKTILKNIKKPVSFVIQIKEGKIPGIVNNNGNTNGNTVGVRFPNTRFLKKLFKEIQYPLITTSANISGEPFPRKFKDIKTGMLDQVDLAVRGRKLSGKPSKVIDLGTGEVLRK
jgi:L-threonylcarbamoyladenylate synthase